MKFAKINHYKFLPVVITLLSIILISIILDGYYAGHVVKQIVNSETLQALRSEAFQHTVFFSIGVLTPLCIDHILTVWTMWSPDMLLHVETYVIPILITLLQIFNLYFAFTEVNSNYFITHLFFVRYQTCVVFNAAFVIQLNAIETIEKKESSTIATTTTVNTRILPMVIFTMTLFNISIILDLLCALYDYEWVVVLWEISFVFVGITSLCILYYWWNKYQIATKTGLQNQSYFFSFLEMLLIVVFVLVLQIFDLFTHDSILLHGSGLHVSTYNLLILASVYAFSEIYVMKNKKLAKFSVEALETKRSFVRYVSHEIRTPLNAATLGLQLLDKELHKHIIRAQEEENQKQLIGTKGTQESTLYKQLLELVADTSQACTIAVDILNDLLMYEKIDGGLLVLEAQEVNLWPYVEEVMKIFSVQSKALELELLWQPLIDTRVFVSIDRYKMSQVIRNIISNALKFSSPGQKVVISAKIIEAHSYNQNIRVHLPHMRKPSVANVNTLQVHPEQRTESEHGSSFDVESQQSKKVPNKMSLSYVFNRLMNFKRLASYAFHEQASKHSVLTANNSVSAHNADIDYIRITVKDFGPGISKDNQKRLFHEVVQFDAAKLQGGKGSGIGLWISNKIMKLHGGKIGVESEGEGLGSEFYIDIPIHHTEVIQISKTNRPRAFLRSLLPVVSEDTAGRQGLLGIAVPRTSSRSSSVARSSTSNSNTNTNRSSPGPSRQGSSRSLLTRLGSATNLFTNRSNNSASTRDGTGGPVGNISNISPFKLAPPIASVAHDLNAPDGALLSPPARFIPKLSSFHEQLDLQDQQASVSTGKNGTNATNMVPIPDPIHTTLDNGSKPSSQAVAESSNGTNGTDSNPMSVNSTPQSRQRLRKNELRNSSAKTPTYASLTQGGSNKGGSSSNHTNSNHTNSNHTNSNHSAGSAQSPFPATPGAVVSNPVPTSSNSNSSPAQPARKKALLVDDSAVNRKMLRKCCLAYFDVCDEAKHGQDAVDQVERQIEIYKQKNQIDSELVALPKECFGYDIIITDYFMPGMNGMELIGKLRAMKYPGKIIGLTGNTEVGMTESFLKAGANMVLIKPLTADDLDKVINAV